VRVIDVDPNHAWRAVERFEEMLRSITWDIQDQVACVEAYELKNGTELSQLRDEWNLKDDQRREQIAHTAGMSRAYIEGLLSSSVALELASSAQRKNLQLLLQVPSSPQQSSLGRLSEREMGLLAEAADNKGLAGSALMEAVLTAENQFIGSRLRRKPLNRDSAEKAIELAMKSVELFLLAGNRC
jgi:hypothetical protein